MENSPLVVSILNIPLLWPYLCRFYLVSKLHYCIIYTASKNIYLHRIHTIDYISFNKSWIEVSFGWKVIYWLYLFRIYHLCNHISATCIVFWSYHIIKINSKNEKQKWISNFASKGSAIKLNKNNLILKITLYARTSVGKYYSLISVWGWFLMTNGGRNHQNHCCL